MVVISQAQAAANVTIAGSTTGVNAFTVIAGEPGAGTQLNLNLPGTNRLNGQPFVVRAAGIINMGAGTYTCSIQPLVFASTTVGFTAAAGNAIAFSSAAVALTYTSTASVATPFELELHCVGDNTSGLLQGWFQGQQPTTSTGTTFTSVTTSPTILGRILTAVNYASEPPLQFSVGIGLTAGTAATGSVATLTSFQVEA